MSCPGLGGSLCAETAFPSSSFRKILKNWREILEKGNNGETLGFASSEEKAHACANACYQELSWLRFVSEVQRGHWTGSIGRCRSSCCYRSRYSISNANRMDGEHRVWASGLCVASSLARMLAAHHHRWWSEFDGTRRNVLANHALRVSTGRSMSENAWSRHLGLHSRAIQCTYRSAES